MSLCISLVKVKMIKAYNETTMPLSHHSVLYVFLRRTWKHDRIFFSSLNYCSWQQLVESILKLIRHNRC